MQDKAGDSKGQRGVPLRGSQRWVVCWCIHLTVHFDRAEKEGVPKTKIL